MGRWDAKPEDRPLTGKQQCCADTWLANGFNGMLAAMAAGYAKNAEDRETVCRVQASQTLALPNVRAYISKKQAIRAEKAGLKGITAERLLDDLVALKDHCLGPLAENAKPDKTTVDQVGANKAIDTIGKHIGFFEADNAQKTATFQQLLIRMGDSNAV